MSKKFSSMFKALCSYKMLAMLALGFSSGFPFYIVKDILKVWITDAGLDLKTIGLFSAVSMPYTFKFIWSPIMDRYTPPFLGRRRGWMLITQILVLISIIVLGQWNPTESLSIIAATALAVSFFGASQDIVLDAFRREYLNEEELGFGSGVWMNAWRLGMYVSVGVSFLAADNGVSYKNIFLLLSMMMFIGIVATFFVKEPKVDLPPPSSFKESVIGPFIEFFSRKGAIRVLLFILLYKVGDNMAGAMNIPYLLKLGFSKTEYFAVVKGLGMFGLFGGVLFGGAIMFRLGLIKSLWVFGILQGLSTLCFAFLEQVNQNGAYRLWALSGVVFFEFLSSGMGQAAYAAYMATQTNKRFTATQYALLTSLMAIPATLAGAFTGYMAEYFGWFGFYLICAVIAIPGLFLIPKEKA